MADFIKKTFTGDTVEDAITQASVAFGLTSDKLGYDVIDKGAKGFLGLGARKVVIEAWDKEAENEARKAAEELAKAAAPVEEAAERVYRAYVGPELIAARSLVTDVIVEILVES